LAAAELELDGDYPTCSTVGCRMVVHRRAEMGEAGFKHYLQLQARQTAQRLTIARLASLQAQAEAQENEAGWAWLRARPSARSAARLQASTPPSVLQLLLPSGPPRQSKPAHGRGQQYGAHLLQIIAQALAASADESGSASLNAAIITDSEQHKTLTDHSIPAAESRLPALLCGQCGGGCCTRGANHAYLSAETIRRVMALKPELAADGLLTVYLDLLPDKTQTGSCINHTARGCSLPKDMRSDTCNLYACESLAKLQAAQLAAQGVQTVLVVQRQQDHWMRGQAGLDNAAKAMIIMNEAGVKRFAPRHQAGALNPARGQAGDATD